MIGDLPFRLATCPLGRREPQNCAFFFGFTGSSRTSLFKLNVSFVFCAGFTTLSRLICCFHVCCIWHFPFSLLAFHLSTFCTYHVACFQFALVPAMCSSFVKCALSKLHLFFLLFIHFQCLPLFNLHFAFPFFLQLSCVPLSDLNFPIPFFSRCKHPRTSAIRQHKSSPR